MRKFFTTFILIGIAVLSSYSQISKGTILLGGSSHFSLNSDGLLDLYLAPNSGYFFNEHICLGAAMPMSYFHSEPNDGYYLGISPFFRYYFGKNDKSRFFALTRLNIEVNEHIYITHAGWVDLGAGYSWFMNESIALETEFITNLEPDKVTAGLYLGFQIYLNRPKK